MLPKVCVYCCVVLLLSYSYSLSHILLLFTTIADQLDIENLSRQERLKARISQSLQATRLQRSSSSLEEEVSRAIERYISQPFVPEQELKAQLKRKGKDWKKESIDWKKVDVAGVDFDVLYISKHFDVAEWWANEGKKLHPLIVLAVPPILSLPASNGHQERTFSVCQHFNNELRQRLKDERFEMSVLLAVNKEYASLKIPTKEEAVAIIADVISGIQEEVDGVNEDERDRIIESQGLGGLEHEVFQEENEHGTSAQITPHKLSF